MFSLIAISLVLIGIYLMLLPLFVMIKLLFAKALHLIKSKTKEIKGENQWVQKHLHYLETKKEEERLNRDWEAFHRKKAHEYDEYLEWCKINKTKVLMKQN